MKKYLLVLILLSSLQISARKRGKELVDSLLIELPKAREDSNKTKLFHHLSVAYRGIDSSAQMNYALQGLELSRKLHYRQGQGDLYVCIANILDDNPANTAKELEYYLKADSLYSEIGDKIGLTIVQSSIAKVYTSKNNASKALEHFFIALKIAEETGDRKEQGIINGDIGIVYIDEKQNEKALEYFRKSMKLNEESGDKNALARNLGNISQVYHSQGKYKEALEYAFKALKLNEETGNKRGIAIKLNNIGNVYNYTHEYQLAITYYQKELAMEDSIGIKSTVAYGSVGQVYYKLATDTLAVNAAIGGKNNKAANLAKAIEYLNKGIAGCLADGDILNTSNFLQDLSEAQQETGNNVGALASFKEYKKLCDSIYNQDNSSKINGIETQRDLDLKDREIKINGLELTKKRNQQVFFFMGIGLLAVITGNVTRNNRKQKRVNKLLTAEKLKSDLLAKNLGTSLEQKDLLMKEIHHRVKNNLQVISALLELQLENVSDEHAIDAMTESTSRVRSISLIHQQLYQVEDISSIEFSKFASDLFKQISIVFNKTGSTISLDNNIAEAWQDIDTAVPLGLILNELLTNSYKYAFVGVGTGTISIKLELQKDNFYHLLYSDSGPGLPENFKMEGLKSLGMRVIRNLSKQIGGRFYYDFDTKVFHVTFKDLAERKRIA